MRIEVFFTQEEYERATRSDDVCMAINCGNLDSCLDCPLYTLTHEDRREYIKNHLEKGEFEK